jgi:hypothetical protein
LINLSSVVRQPFTHDSREGILAFKPFRR